MCGYKHTISRNLTIIAGIFFLILLTVSLLCLIDLIKQRSNERRCSAYMCNILTRFSYEFYLEICLSVLIQVTAMQMMKSELEEKVSITSLAVASLFLLGIVAFVGFMVSRFWFGGPYIEQTYQSKSFAKSWWGIRTLSDLVRNSNELTTEF